MQEDNLETIDVAEIGNNLSAVANEISQYVGDNCEADITEAI